MHPLLLFLGGLLLLLNLHVRFGDKRLDRFDKGLVLRLLDEVDNVVALATTEALEGAGVGEDVERWRSLIVEGTAAHIARAGLAELDVLTDDLHDIGALQYGVDDFLSYHNLGVKNNATHPQPHGFRCVDFTICIEFRRFTFLLVGLCTHF